jgi:hypothetical protein
MLQSDRVMRLPRKGILIRIVVYGGLLGFFGWRAFKPHVTDPANSPSDARRLEELRQHSRTVTLPDGETQVIYEITPEQAERLFGIRPDVRAEAEQAGSVEAGAEAKNTGGEPPAAAGSTGPGDTGATSSDSGDDASTASH